MLNVSDPAQPRPVGSCELPDDVRGLAVAGKHVYASMSDLTIDTQGMDVATICRSIEEYLTARGPM